MSSTKQMQIGVKVGDPDATKVDLSLYDEGAETVTTVHLPPALARSISRSLADGAEMAEENQTADATEGTGSTS